MKVENAVLPRGEQLQALLAAKADGPIVMLNLLKFHPRARYEDGDHGLTGAEAYGLYGVEVTKLVLKLGGRMIYFGPAEAVTIGDVTPNWNSVALVEYPSRAAFVQMAMSPEMEKIAHHRKAGLEGQLLIQCPATPK